MGQTKRRVGVGRSRNKREVLTKEVHEAVVRCINAGGHIETAAAFAGISLKSLNKWLLEGATKSHGKARDLHHDVDVALAKFEMAHISYLNNAAKTSTHAAQWMLERRFPERWGKKDRVSLEGKDGGPVKYQVEYVNDWRESTSPVATPGHSRGK